MVLTRKKEFVLFLGICLVTSWGTYAQAQIHDGNFAENPNTSWMGADSNNPPGSRGAGISPVGGDPNECGILGRRGGANGCQSATLFQIFHCDCAPDLRCCISFDALYPAGAVGETAIVDLVTSKGVTTAVIPVAAGWIHYQLAGPPKSCDNLAIVAFSLNGGIAGTTTTLRIDNVASVCDANDITTGLEKTQKDLPGCPCDPNNLTIAECNDCGHIVGFDSIPIYPAISQWRLIVLALLLLIVGAVVIRRRLRTV